MTAPPGLPDFSDLLSDDERPDTTHRDALQAALDPVPIPADLDEHPQLVDPQTPIDPIPGVMNAREVHLLSGSPHAGKTSILAWMVKQLLEKDRILAWPLDPRKLPFIGYICGDRGLRDAEEKFRLAGWDEPPVYGLVDDQRSALPDKELHRLRHRDSKVVAEDPFPLFTHALHALATRWFPWEKRLPDDSLIIVDGMALFFGIEPAGRYSSDVGAPLTQLARLCQKRRLTVLLTHHAGKQGAEKSKRYARPQDRVLGSTALQGFTSTQLQIAEPLLTQRPELGLHQFTVVPHGGAPATAWLQRLEDGQFGVVNESDLPEAAPAPQAATSYQLTESQKSILEVLGKEEYLEGGPVTLSLREYLLQAGVMSRPTFYRALGDLKELGLVEEIKAERGMSSIRLKGEKPAN